MRDKKLMLSFGNLTVDPNRIIGYRTFNYDPVKEQPTKDPTGHYRVSLYVDGLPGTNNMDSPEDHYLLTGPKAAAFLDFANEMYRIRSLDKTDDPDTTSGDEVADPH